MKAADLNAALLLVGGGADAPDVHYACGFHAPDPFLYLQAGGKKHLLVSPLEQGRAARLPDVQVHTADSLGLPAAARRSPALQAVGLLRKLHLRRLRVSRRCPVGLVRDLEAAGLRVILVPDPIFPARIRKGPEELQHLRRVQRAAVAGLRAARACIAGASIDAGSGRLRWRGRPLTAERVRAEAQHALLDLGCQAEELIVAGGDQAVDPHERGHGPLSAGQLIVLDVFPRGPAGYWGDITRTVLKGEPTPAQRALYETVLRAQRAALARVAPGVSAAEIHDGIVRAFAEAGYETGLKEGIPQGFIHSTGHGVGLEIHEAPSISPAGGRLEEGQVITIEPGLYYRGIGGVRIEDTVEVIPGGCRPLATCAKDWIL